VFYDWTHILGKRKHEGKQFSSGGSKKRECSGGVSFSTKRILSEIFQKQEGTSYAPRQEKRRGEKSLIRRRKQRRRRSGKKFPEPEGKLRPPMLKRGGQKNEVFYLAVLLEDKKKKTS